MIDRRIVLAVVFQLGGIAFVLVGGIVYASITGKTIDNGVSTLAGSVVGYLGGILTNVTKVAMSGGTTVTVPSDPPTTATVSSKATPTEGGTHEP